MRLRRLALLTLALLPLSASAQFMSGATGAPVPFTLSVSPQFPEPNGQAVVSFLSSTIDLAAATLSVSVAGKVTYQGSVQPVAVALGKGGTRTTAVATIKANGVPYTQSITIVPQDVSLVAEPVASVPPLYPGKARVPLEGAVRVVALANLKTAAGKSLDPASVAYSWTVDDTQIANSSGIGRQAVLVASPLQYRNRTVSVTVTSQDGSLVGGASLSLDPEDPTLRVYENDPLLGIRFERALEGSYTIAGAESTLYAAPLSLTTTGGAPRIQWFLNGTAAQTGPSITLRPAGSGGGNASLSVVASAGEYSTVTKALSLLFGNTEGSNFLGL